MLLASAASVLNAPLVLSADLTITSERTTPVNTTTGDGTGPGNIIVQSGGSINVTGNTTLTINSSYTVLNAGAIGNAQESGATSILVLTTKDGIASNITSTITNQGGINVVGPSITSTLANADVFNAGIKVSGLGTFTGDIINDSVTTPTIASGAILVGGNASAGITVQSSMIGALTNKGSIIANGNGSFGIATTGGIVGNFTNSGLITAGGANAVGTYIGGGLDGTFLVGGSMTVGTGAVVTSTNGVNLITLDPLPAKAGIWLASNVTQGVLLTGNGLTRGQEQLDPTAAAAATPPDASIAVVGGPALLITQGGLNSTSANITVGPGPGNGGYSVKNQGNFLVDGTVKGLNASAITIQGSAGGATTYTSTLSGGLWNDRGNIEVAAQDAVATGISIGNYGIVSRLQNDGDLLVNTVDSTSNALTGAAGTKGGSAYGILIESLGSLTSFNNTRNIVVTAQGSSSSAFGVIDRSGRLNSFTNSGLINTLIQDGSTGKLTAVDLSANTTGITFANTGTIIGDVYLGAGSTSVSIAGADASITGGITFQAGATKTGSSNLTMNAGAVLGAISLGNGNHTFTLTNGAKATGGLTQGTGLLSLAVDSSRVTILSTRQIAASSAAITGTSIVTFDINNSAALLPGAILQSAGVVSVSAGSKLTAAFTGLLEGEKTITLIRAGSLVLGATLSQTATAPTSYINSTAFNLSPTDANTLQLTVRRKSAAELALGPNATATYNSFSAALNQDAPVVTAVSALQTRAEFETGLQQLMPDSSGALQQAALNNQDMSAGAIRRRLVGVAKNGMPDHAAGDISSFWAQALGDFGDQKPHGEQAGFNVWGLGIAFGADMPAFDGSTILGIGFSETWHSANLKVSAKSPVEFYNSQANFYGRYSGDSLYIQAVGGAGYNSYNQERRVNVGSVSRLSIGKWKGYEYGGTIETGLAARFSAYEFTPFIRASYLKNHENRYTEQSGGTGVNLTVAPRIADNARASVGLTIDRDFPIFYDSYVEAELRGNFTREFKNDPYAVVAQFAVGPTFVNMSTPRSPNRANIGIGFAHKDSYSSVSVDYDAEISKGYLAHKAAVTARFRF